VTNLYLIWYCPLLTPLWPGWRSGQSTGFWS
jgi:hypothetical protein